VNATRHNQGKPQLSMVLEARKGLEAAARALEFGQRKYDRANWKKGLKTTQILDSLLRHTTKLLDPQSPDEDDESGLNHVDHIVANALFLAEYVGTEFDDRAKLEAPL